MIYQVFIGDIFQVFLFILMIDLLLYKAKIKPVRKWHLFSEFFFIDFMQYSHFHIDHSHMVNYFSTMCEK